MTSTGRRIGRHGAALALWLGCCSTLALLAQGNRGAGWVTAWGTSQQALGDDRVTNATVRMIAKVTIPGNAVRIRLSNAYGTQPLTIGRASAGLRIRGAAIAPGSAVAVTFSGVATVVVPPGGTVTSDAVPLRVRARQDVAVSLYVPDGNVRPSQHTGAQVTSYRSSDNSGDLTLVQAADRFDGSTTAMWWLKAVDVQGDAPGAIVMFGDSITDGTCTTLDAHDRWEDLVSIRLGLEAEARRGGRGAAGGLMAVVNEGIGGNTITREGLMPPPDSTPGLERVDRDVLAHTGVRDVVLFMGTNDIRRGASGASVMAGMTTIAQRLRSQGLRVIAATIIPRHNVAPAGTNTGWDAGKTRIRNEVNAWIQGKAAPFDGVIDFARVVRDPRDPDRIDAPLDCGDGIHPSPAGYYEMGKAVDLRLFGRGR